MSSRKTARTAPAARNAAYPQAARTLRWSVSDIVVASVLAVAGGVIFWGWNLSYHLVGNLFVAYPPLSTLVHGMWLFPAVLGAIIIRKPGAAIFCETVAATISALLGAQWGMTVLLYGALQGLGAELIFLLVLYRRFSLELSLLAGFGAGLMGGITMHYIMRSTVYAPAETLISIGSFAISGMIIAGLLPWLATRALAAASVLGPLASRKAHQEPVFIGGKYRS